MTDNKSRTKLLIVATTGTLIGGGFAIHMYRQAHAAGVPTDVPIAYAGHLTDNGVGVTGMRAIGVSLYATASANAALCTAPSIDTVVTAGHFRRTFEASCNQSLLATATDPHIEVSVAGVTVGGRVRIGAVPYAIEAVNSAKADNGVPVGGIIDWWRPSGSTATPPAGFVICDGSVINDASSPYNGMNAPDLRGRFVQGVNAIADIGTTGGAATHTHDTDLAAHTHTTDIDHDHALLSASGTAASAGSHAHVSLEFDGIDWLDGQNNIIGNWTNGFTQPAGSGFYPMFANNAGNIMSSMTGAHTHSVTSSVNLPALGATLATSSQHDPAATTSTAASSMPPYYGLLKIIRIK